MNYETPRLSVVDAAQSLILGAIHGDDDNVMGGPKLDPELAVGLDD
jgi:hypothetical protein